MTVRQPRKPRRAVAAELRRLGHKVRPSAKLYRRKGRNAAA